MARNIGPGDIKHQTHIMIAVLLPTVGIEPTSRYQRTFLRRKPYTTRLPKYLSKSINTSVAEWYKASVVRRFFGTATWVRFPPSVKGLRSQRPSSYNLVTEMLGIELPSGISTENPLSYATTTTCGYCGHNHMRSECKLIQSDKTQFLQPRNRNAGN